MLKRMLWRCAAIALIASAGFGVRAARADDDEQAASGGTSVDAQIGKLSDQMTVVEKEFTDLPVAAEARCRENFNGQSLDGVLMSSKGMSIALLRNLFLAHTCHAVSVGSMAGCSDPENLGSSADRSKDPAAVMGSPETHCQDLYAELARVKAIMTGKDSPANAMQLCLASFARTNDSNPGARMDAGQFCQIYMRHTDDTRARVAALSPIIRSKHPGIAGAALDAEISRMESADRMNAGEAPPATCQAKGKDFSSKDFIPSRQACTTAYYYRAAYSQGSAEACGKSGLCRALMGEPHACDSVNDSVRDSYCANLYVNLKANKSEERLTKLTERVAAMKGKADALEASLGSSARDAERKQRVASLKQKCAAMDRTLKDAAAIRHNPDDVNATMDSWEPKRF